MCAVQTHIPYRLSNRIAAGRSSPGKSVNLAEGLWYVCNPTLRVGFKMLCIRDVYIPVVQLFCFLPPEYRCAKKNDIYAYKNTICDVGRIYTRKPSI